MLKVAELALDAAVAAVVTARSADGADEMWRPKRGRTLLRLLRAHPHPRSQAGLRSPETLGSACGLGGQACPGSGWSLLCRCFPAQLLLFLLFASAMWLIFQILIRREYRDRFT